MYVCLLRYFCAVQSHVIGHKEAIVCHIGGIQIIDYSFFWNLALRLLLRLLFVPLVFILFSNWA